MRIDLIPDPESFLQKIHAAYAIKRFRADFTGPNPIDADEIFQKPMSYYCQQLGADKGNVSVVGPSLDEDAVTEVTKSTAATGNKASARIQNTQGGRTIPISLKAQAKTITIPHDAEDEEILRRIQLAYKEVRE
ncbi:hypothetical protein [Polaromonas sp.]|uniref:hypothetical protein n=1 Tax=Polaromonas sp. TaxID=1869339 RepID=UPI0025F7D871|nr:hypothetical protein [Polaromonas sp.]